MATRFARSATGLSAAIAAGVLLCGGGVAEGGVTPDGMVLAHSKVQILQAPTIAGTAQVGQTLTATGARWSGPAGTTAVYTWLRCTGTSLWTCLPIAGGAGPSYQATTADLGARLRVWLRVWSRHSQDDAVSAATAPVVAAPVAKPTPPPTPTPIPTPTATPTPTPTPTPIPIPSPTPTPTPKPTPLLQPFPIVHIHGWLTATGARVSLLTVRAPRGARVTVLCHGGRGCPAPRLAQIAVLVRLKRFERFYRAGTRIEIRVSKSGFIGKDTVFVIRRGKPPWRRDRCLAAGKVVRCAAS